MAVGTIPLCLWITLSLVYSTKAVTNEELKDMLVTLTESQAKTRIEVQELKQTLDKHEEEKQQMIAHLTDLVQDVRSLVTYHEEEDPKRKLHAEKLEKSLEIILGKLEPLVLPAVGTTVLPARTTTTVAVPVPGGSGSVCGSIAEPDTRDRAPSGWVLCYITPTQHREYRNTLCKSLIRDLVQTGTGRRYANDRELLSAGGNFGCWRGSEGLSGRLHAACQEDYQHSGKLNDCGHCNILGVCIKYPTS